MREFINATTVANQARLLRDIHSGPIILTEDGPSAVYLKNVVVDQYTVSVIVSHGKPNLYEALEELSEDTLVLGIADADYERLLGESRRSNCIWFDHRDLEVALVCSASFDRVVAEFCGGRGDVSSLRDDVLRAAAIIGTARLESARRGHVVSFQELLVHEHYVARSRSLNTSSLTRWLDARCSVDFRVQCRTAFGEDVRDLARGHDVIALAAMQLRHDCDPDITPRVLERELRLAARPDDLSSSQFLKDARAWEAQRKTVLLAGALAA